LEKKQVILPVEGKIDDILDNDEGDEETTIILKDPVTDADLTCDECGRKLSSIQAFTYHMKTQHEVNVIKEKKTRKGDAKKAEMKAKKDLKEKQKQIPRSILDIKNLVPEGVEKRERARILFKHIKESKHVPLSAQVISDLEKRESEIFEREPDGLHLNSMMTGGDGANSTLGSQPQNKDKRTREPMIGEEKLTVIRNETVKASMDGQILAKKSKKAIQEERIEQYVDFDTDSIVEFIRAKGFHDDVCEAFQKARITGYNIPELVNKDFLKSIGITIVGDLGGLSHMFQMIIDAENE